MLPKPLTPLDIQNAFDACTQRKSNLDYLACIANALNRTMGLSTKPKRATEPPPCIT